MTERRAHIVPRTPVSSVRVLSASPYSRRQTQCASAPVAEPSVVQTVYAVSFRKQLRRTALPVLLTVLLTMAASCSREPVGGGEYGVYVTVSSGTSAGTSGATKGMPDATDNDDYRSIAIFAFTVPDDRLAGYVCHHSISAGQTRFPMTLDGSGTFDFYVILNPNSLNSSDDFFEIADADGERVDFPEQNVSSAVIPDAIADLTPADIQSWRVRIRDGAEDPKDSGYMGSWDGSGYGSKTWYAPMTNVPGSGNTNLRYTVPDTDIITNIPISVTRAVSKVRMMFVAKDEDYRDPYSRDGRNQAFESLNYLNDISLSQPLSQAELYTETTGSVPEGYYDGNGTAVVQSYGSGTAGREIAKEDYDPNQVEDFQILFTRLWEYYLFPNMFGSGSENSTDIDVRYTYHSRTGVVVGWGNNDVTWNRWIAEDKSVTVSLPAFGRNTCINVWCALNDETDRSFTYTVSDWDETVEVNVPDFN